MSAPFDRPPWGELPSNLLLSFKMANANTTDIVSGRKEDAQLRQKGYYDTGEMNKVQDELAP